MTKGDEPLKRATPMLVVLALLCGGVGQGEAAPVVLNGSFEAVQIGSPFVSNNVSNIPDWTHTGSLGDGPLWHVGYADGGGSVTVAGDGNQFVTLGGGFDQFGSSSFDQVVSGFTPGSTYTLTFKMATEGTFSLPQSITVDFPTGSSTSAQTFTAATPSVSYWTDWETKTENFIATSASVDIRFSVTNLEFDVGLDSVSVSPTAIPEPSTLILLGIGVAGIAGYSWRRRKPAAA
jgi:hypothetical protein